MLWLLLGNIWATLYFNIWSHWLWTKIVLQLSKLAKKEYHGMADLLFDSFGFEQASKSVVYVTYAMQLNQNRLNRKSAVHWYFPSQKLSQ